MTAYTPSCQAAPVDGLPTAQEARTPHEAAGDADQEMLALVAELLSDFRLLRSTLTQMSEVTHG